MAMEYSKDLVIVTLNGTDYIVKLDEAITLMKILGDAPKYDDRWVGTGNRTCHIGGGQISVAIRSLAHEKFVEGIVNGPFKYESER